ncbi:MAG: hypothetical protein WCS77_07415 [Elusimicrobiaceae bacterium]
MKKIRFEFALELTKSRLFCLVFAGLLPLLWTNAGSETITMKSYYPSPYGSYSRFNVANIANLASKGGSVTIGAAATPATLTLNGRFDQPSGDSWLAQTGKSYMTLGSTLTTKETKLNIGGYLAVNNIWVKDANGGAGAWVTDMGSIKEIRVKEGAGSFGTGTITVTCDEGFNLLACSSSEGDMCESDETFNMIPNLANRSCTIAVKSGAGHYTGPVYDQRQKVFAFCYR